LIIIGVLVVWTYNPGVPAIYPLTVLVVQLLLGTLEYWLPARGDWVHPAREKITLVVIVLVLSTATLMVAAGYDNLLRAPLAATRATLNLNIWPHHWPLVAQVFMVFFASEFIWYWFHRAEHRWRLVWRLSGHGAHHAFKRLGAINFGANHPLEMFLLVLPAALVELLFGVGVAAAGAATLTVAQASIAHTNLKLNTNWIGWLFTTNAYHIRHHSAVLDESNTNYGCATIVWDRLFGTFEEGPVAEAGIGPTEPTTWAKFLMPIREPFDSNIAP